MLFLLKKLISTDAGRNAMHTYSGNEYVCIALLPMDSVRQMAGVANLLNDLVGETKRSRNAEVRRLYQTKQLTKRQTYAALLSVFKQMGQMSCQVPRVFR